MKNSKLKALVKKSIASERSLDVTILNPEALDAIMGGYCTSNACGTFRGDCGNNSCGTYNGCGC